MSVTRAIACLAVLAMLTCTPALAQTAKPRVLFVLCRPAPRPPLEPWPLRTDETASTLTYPDS